MGQLGVIGFLKFKKNGNFFFFKLVYVQNYYYDENFESFCYMQMFKWYIMLSICKKVYIKGLYYILYIKRLIYIFDFFNICVFVEFLVKFEF